MDAHLNRVWLAPNFTKRQKEIKLDVNQSYQQQAEPRSFLLGRRGAARSSVDKANESQTSIAAAIFGSIRTVVSLGAEGNLAAKYTLWIEEARQRGRTMSLFLGAQLGLMFFAMYSSYSLAFWFGLKLFRDGHIGSINTVIT